ESIPIGCYNEGTPRTLDMFEWDSSDVTATECVNFCYESMSPLEVIYAGVQGTVCTCGTTYHTYGEGVDEDCNTPCSADSSQICGGDSSISVAEIRIGSYMGCFNDGTPRALSSASKTGYDGMTAGACIGFCTQRAASSQYAGVQAGDECYCGNSYDTYGHADESDCNEQCSGDSSEICGGTMLSSVHLMGY
ncbi:uncharacterized protein LOC102805667, partial [Saccoglossus kowalevskii]|uniref:WSC domain-containing protein 2-like n=1 Tax=Saccoglossus kowalevskii TaxID=10224 RepID=A0ABM0MRA0_SACKO